MCHLPDLTCSCWSHTPLATGLVFCCATTHQSRFVPFHQPPCKAGVDRMASLPCSACFSQASQGFFIGSACSLHIYLPPQFAVSLRVNVGHTGSSRVVPNTSVACNPPLVFTQRNKPFSFLTGQHTRPSLHMAGQSTCAAPGCVVYVNVWLQPLAEPAYAA